MNVCIHVLTNSQTLLFVKYTGNGYFQSCVSQFPMKSCLNAMKLIYTLYNNVRLLKLNPFERHKSIGKSQLKYAEFVEGIIKLVCSFSVVVIFYPLQ